MFRFAQYALRASHHAIRWPMIVRRTYLSDRYQAFEKWDDALASEILRKTNISTSFVIIRLICFLFVR